MKQHLLEDYAREWPSLQNIEQQVIDQLRQLLRAEALNVHSLSSRIKEPDSLARKLRRPDRTYHALTDVTDLIGIRIITYFEDTIEEIAALIEKAFEVDYDRSIDKRKSLDVSHFGYRSLHYICRLKDSPPDMPCFELQIRTILQHAWAETEHDLGYKTEASIPLEIRRRFSRVASLLEVADAEFLSIRRFLEDYEQSVRQKLKDTDAVLGVDLVSLEQFLSGPEATEIETCFATRIGVTLSQDFFYPDYLIRMLNAVGVSDISELRETLLSHQEDLLQFIRPYFEFTRRTWQFGSQDLGQFLRGYSLVFLAHFLLIKDNPLAIVRLEKLTRFYQEIDYPHDESTARAVAKNLLEALNSSDKND
jgi:putative GTP pyrophosphokinase